MHIRLAHPADAPAIARVHVSSWQTTYRNLLPAGFLAALRTEPRERYSANVLSITLGGQIVYIAENPADSVVAFASGGPNREAGSEYNGELYAIYILEDYQRQGIGKALVPVVAGNLAESGMRAMLVWVLAGNPSCHFYEVLGGQRLHSKPIDVGGFQQEEVAYGWPDIHMLLA